MEERADKMSDQELSAFVTHRAAHDALERVIAADNVLASSQALADLFRAISGAVLVRQAGL